MGPKGDQVLEARLVRKYGGIKWLDPANGYRACEAHPNDVAFEKKRGNNRYIIFGTYHGFDLDKDLEEQQEKYEFWEKTEDFYDQVKEYYKDSEEVEIHTQGGECDSESDVEGN